MAPVWEKTPVWEKMKHISFFALQIEKYDLHWGKKKSYCQCAFVGFSCVLLFSNFYILLIQVKDFF